MTGANQFDVGEQNKCGRDKGRGMEGETMYKTLALNMCRTAL